MKYHLFLVTLVSFIVFMALDWVQPGLISLYIHPLLLLPFVFFFALILT